MLVSARFPASASFRDTVSRAALLAVSLFCAGLAKAEPAPARLLAAGRSPVHPIAVFGPDERKPLPQSRAALAEKIGVLSVGDATFCTAFCVANDTIATASHCLLGTEQIPGPDLERVTFKVGGAEPLSTKLAGDDRSRMRSVLRSGTPLLRVTPPIAAAKDWAVVRLAKPVCRAGGLTLSKLSRDEVQMRAEAGEIYQVAMHRDVSPDKIVTSGPCALPTAFPLADAGAIAQDFVDPAAILMHTCDTGPGSSGSPLLVDTASGPEVLGINVGTYIISRTATSTSSSSGPARENDAIANTAIEASRFRGAVEMFTLQTPATGSGTRVIRGRDY